MEPECSRRLDMSHGFMKSIVRNQISRDEFHKFMEEKRQQTEKSLAEAAEIASGRRRRQNANGVALYVPPHLRKSDAPKTPPRRPVTSPIVDFEEEEKLRERMRNHFKERFSVTPSMTFKNKQNSEGNSPARVLFTLSLAQENGDYIQVPYTTSDNPARLAKELSRKHGYSDPQCRDLRLTIELELEKHSVPIIELETLSL